MISYANPDELFQHLRELKLGYDPMRREVAMYGAVGACYHEGVQWLFTSGQGGSASVGQYLSNWNTDTPRLRVTANKITRNIQKVVAQTEPTGISFDFSPPERDSGPESLMRAGALEAGTRALLGKCGFLDARVVANLRRCIMGDAGIGLAIENSSRTLSINGKSVEAPDRTLRAFTFYPSDLVLDPYIQDRDLRRHDTVSLRLVWTAAKIERVYGVKLKEDELQTVGALASFETEFGRMSNGRIFSQHMLHSKSKGAVVWQVHCKDETGRFGQMYVVIDKGGSKAATTQDMTLVNEGDTATPFGGCGMPLSLYHAVKRTDSMWSISDVWMMRDLQDLVNMTETHRQRAMQNYAHYKWLIDRSTLKDKGAEESLNNQINNRVGGPIFYDTRNQQRVMKPEIAAMPQPPALLGEMMAEYGNEMEKQISTAPINFGQAKSHVSDSTNQTLVDQAGQVSNIRVKGDLRTDTAFIEMLTGTMVLLAREETPGVLGALVGAGLDEGDLAAIISCDPSNLPVTINVRESSVRNRSPEGRRTDIKELLTLKAIDPIDAREELAGDLDTPATMTDRLMKMEADRAAMAVVSGQAWTPLPLGAYTTFFTQAFRNALFSKAAVRDPATRQRLADAIQLQERATALQAAANNPETIAAQMQAQAAAPQEQPQAPETMTVGDALALATGSNASQAGSSGLAA